MRNDFVQAGSTKALFRHALTVLAVLAILAVIALVRAPGVDAKSELLPAEDLDGRTATLRINIVYEDGEDKYPVKNAKVLLYKVATVSVKGGKADYTAVKRFSPAGIKYEGMTIDESRKASKKLVKMIQDKNMSSDRSGRTNGDGLVVFDNLKPGMYLAVQKDFVRINKKKSVKVEPTLYLAPDWEKATGEDGEYYRWVYDLSVYPKPGAKVKKHPNPPKPPVRTPKTGDTNNLVPLLLTFGIALICLLIVVFLYRRGRRD